MSTRIRRCWLTACWVWLLATLKLLAQSADTDWSLAVLDRTLANVRPGQQLVQLGDMQILVANLQAWRDRLAGQPQPQLAFDGTAPTWTGGKVYYTFDPSVSAANQKVFLDGANEWAIFANLQFSARTTQANYVTIQQNASLEGGQSAVGMVGGQQFLQIGPTAWNRPTICHELGHTLGLVHEQQRPDRGSFVSMLTNNIAPGEEGNFVILSNAVTHGAYDFLSVMHYARNALSISPSLDTVEPLPAYAQFLNLMGQQFDPVLSAEDRAGMAAVYGAGPPLTSMVTNTQDSGAGSLRAAFYYGLDHPGTTITFNIPASDPGFSNQVYNILPTDRFPSLVNATVLDGSTQPNSNPSGPAVQLNGKLAPSTSTFANGLRLGGTNCSVRSIILNGFAAAGILIEGTNATGNTVRGCYLGVDATGTMPVTNGFSPVTIQSGASGNTIGGTIAASRNIISGSYYQGVVIRDSGTRSNVVQGNYIGLKATGSAALSNRWSGVNILNGAQANTIGGAAPGAGNVISGNGIQGVLIQDLGSSGNVVQGNLIGLNAAGTAAIPNGGVGLEVYDGPQGMVIGGTNAGTRNFVAGNSSVGIYLHVGISGTVVQGNYIGLNAAGTQAIPNSTAGIQISEGAPSNLVGGASPAMRNVISGNGAQGLIIGSPGTTNNVVQGNYIGVNPAGTAALPNGGAGLAVFGGAQNNLVGGAASGAGNLISGNGTQGLALQDAGTTVNVVQGNFVGVDASGTAAIPNGWSGVNFFGGASSNLVGGTAPGAGNLISGNGHEGVLLQDPGTTNNVVQGNFIGINLTGSGALSNGWSGVELYSGPQGNLIGGSGTGNLISGNGNYGVLLQVTGTANNMVQGNYIGVNAAGNTAIPNASAGIGMFNGAQSNLIGGSLPGLGNVISGNTGDGLQLANPGTTGNLFQGNLIGLDATGATAIPNHGYAAIEIYNSASFNVLGGGIGARNVISGNSGHGIALSGNSTSQLIQGNTIGLNAFGTAAVPNGGVGIQMFGGTVSNQIGGITLGAANFLADGLNDAIEMFDATTTNNSVRGNSIFGNAGAGIVLVTGANGSAVAPSLSSAVVATGTTIKGSLSSLPNTTFHIDYYGNPPPLGSAQAKTFLGSQDVVTGVGGSATFTNNSLAVVPVGQIITASATDPAGNTSPFSAGVTVTATDSVGDGIPDAWRAAHFGGSGTTTNSSSCAACDPDHDGLSNLQEFLAGTNPTNAMSALHLTSVNKSGTNVVVSFQSVASVVYHLEAQPDLSTAAWSVLVDQILGTGGLVQVTIPGAATLSRQFYRLAVTPP